MHILMTTDTMGGVWSYATTLARGLASFGVQITLAAMGRPASDDQRAAAAALPNVRLLEQPYRLEWMDEPWADVDLAGQWLQQLERELDADLVHINGYAHAAVNFRSPVVSVAHSCVLSWWQAVHRAAAPTRYDVYRDRVSRGVHAADVVVAPTRAMLDCVTAYYGRPADGRTIYNACDETRFLAANPQQSANKQPIVFSAGRLWDPAKNVWALDAVAARLPWPVFVAGDAEHPDGTPTTFASAVALGALSAGAVAAWMDRASIYALPARYEPFGLSVLEAARSGCALVLGDITSLRELWDGAALFVEPDEHAALASAIRRLAEQPEFCRHMGERAAERAERYALRLHVSAYARLYAELTHQPSPIESGRLDTVGMPA